MNKKLAAALLVLTILFATSCGTAKEIPDLTSDSLEPSSIASAEDAVLVDLPEPVATTKMPTAKKADASAKTPAQEAGAPDTPAAAPASPTLIGDSADNVSSISDYLYDDAYMFNPFGYAVVGTKTDGVMKYGMIREDGTYIIEPQYEAFHSTMENLTSNTPEKDIGYVWFQKDGRWGFINETCEWVLEPTYEDCTCFTSLGLAGVKTDGKWGFVSTSGELVVDPIYDEIVISDTGKYANVCKDGKWGLVDRNGKEVLAPISETYILTDGERSEFGIWDAAGQEIALINNATTLITLDGKVLVDNAKYEIQDVGANQLVYVNSETSGNGYFNMNGELVIPLAEDEIGYPFSEEGIAAVITINADQGNSCHYIDEQGNTLFGRNFEDFNSLPGTFPGAVKVGGKYGYIDIKGVMVIEPAFDCAYCFDNNGYAIVELDGKEAIIDSKGNLMTDFVYDDLSRLDPIDPAASLYIAEQDGTYGVIDVNGNWILPPQYDYIMPYRPGADEGWMIESYSGTTYAMICKDGKFGILSMQADILLQPTGDRGFYLVAPNGYVVIESGGKFGYIDIEK